MSPNRDTNSDLPPDLSEQLHHPESHVRLEALETLGDEALPKRLVPVAAKCLADSDPGIRETAARLLSEHSSKRAAEHVVPHLGSAQIATRNLAAELLAEMGDPAVDALAPLLHDSDPGVRELALEVLAQLPARPLADNIADRLDDTDPNVRIAAVTALGALQASEHQDALRRLYARDAAARPAVIRAVGQFGSDADLDLIKTGLEDDDPTVQLAAAEALGTQGNPEAIDLLLDMTDAVHPMARPVVIRSLIRLCERHPRYQDRLPGTMRDDLLDMLGDSDEEYRRAAAQGLQWFLDGATAAAMLKHAGQDSELDMELLTTLMAHPDPSVPLQRAEEAGHMSSETTAIFSLSILAQQGLPDQTIRKIAPQLCNHFDALGTDDKITALGLLTELDHPALAPLLDIARSDADEQVRTLARDLEAPSQGESASPPEASRL